MPFDDWLAGTPDFEAHAITTVKRLYPAAGMAMVPQLEIPAVCATAATPCTAGSQPHTASALAGTSCALA